MRSLRNKIVVLTGAAAGIGRAIALRLAQEGSHLYLLDMNEVGLNNVAALARQTGVDVLARRCDVRSQQEIVSAVEHLFDRWGTADVLINNAGIASFGPTTQITDAELQQVLDVNLLGPMLFTRQLLPTLLERPEAHILNIASFFGLIGTRRVSAYTASKFGLVGFSESLRAEYARTGLGVTAFCPGFVDTDLFSVSWKKQAAREQVGRLPPAWMLTTPEKIADQAVKAIHRNQALVVTQWYARLAYYGKRFLPGFLDWANHLSRKRFQPKPTVQEVAPGESRDAA